MATSHAPIVKMELSPQRGDAVSFDELERLLSALRDVPITRSVTDAPIAAMRAEVLHFESRWIAPAGAVT